MSQVLKLARAIAICCSCLFLSAQEKSIKTIEGNTMSVDSLERFILLEKYELSEYYSDPEYNRKQNGEIKTILDHEMKEVKINCDVIIHSRGNNIGNDNLLALEMKKSNRPEYEKASDKIRLRALTKESYDDVWSNDGKTFPEYVCGYELGIYMELDIDNRNCYF
ncbi:hypothetical protein [Sinomicrobium sp. M5D2P9]